VYPNDGMKCPFSKPLPSVKTGVFADYCHVLAFSYTLLNKIGSREAAIPSFFCTFARSKTQ
jgi:hypothetical protein